jgi:hypothetical protein
VHVSGVQSLTIYVGCDGQGSTGGWGFSKGGNGFTDSSVVSANGGGGGGSSAIVPDNSSQPVVVASGGGGGGGNNLAPHYRLGGATRSAALSPSTHPGL